MARIKNCPVKKLGPHPATPLDPSASTEVVKKPRRFKAGTVAIREIRRQQKGSKLLINKTCFKRVVREIAQNCSSLVRFTPTSMEALQEAAEDMMVDTLRRAQINAIHCKRTTIMAKDLQLAAEDSCVGNK
jgi:histone H3/H4